MHRQGPGTGAATLAQAAACYSLPKQAGAGANAGGPHINSGEATPANAAQGSGVLSWKAQPPPSTSVPSTPSPPPPLPRLDPRSHPIRPLSAPRSEKRLRTEQGPAARGVWARVESRGVRARNPPFSVQEAKGQRRLGPDSSLGGGGSYTRWAGVRGAWAHPSP